jgi:hypothetical protein
MEKLRFRELESTCSTIYSGKGFSIKRKESCTHVTTWMDLEALC